MAITASSASKNRVFRSLANRSIFEDAGPVLGTLTANQGDLLCWDSGSNVIKLVAATSDAATFLGISTSVVVSGKVKSAFTTSVDSAQGVTDVQGPQYGCVANLKLKNGDTFTKGCKVYLADGADTMTVSSVDPGDHNYVGIYQDATVTAGASSEGPVLIGARYPRASGGDLVF